VRMTVPDVRMEYGIKLMAGMLLIHCGLCLPSIADSVQVEAIHVHGQTFLTWSEEPTSNERVAYEIYRGQAPIQTNTFEDAELLARIGPDSAFSPAAGRRFVLPGRSEPIVEDKGFYVVTPLTPGLTYYAIRVCRIIDGTRTETVRVRVPEGPVQETPASPEPVLQWTESPVSRHPGNYYIVWLGSADPTGRYPTYGYANRHCHPFAFRICFPQSYDAARMYPLLLVLHSGVKTWQSYEAEFGDGIALIPDDRVFFSDDAKDYLWTLWYGYNCNYRTGKPLEEGVVVNYTERSLLYTLDWVFRNVSVDLNRVYCWGSSMGGMGALSFGVRHPEIFAMIDAQFANVDQRNDTWLESRIAVTCGTSRTQEGIDLWERLNLNHFLRTHPEDLPFLRLWNGKNDVLIKWDSVDPPSTFVEFTKVLNETRHGGLFVWTQNESYLGHGGETPSSALPEWAEPDSWAAFRFRFRLNSSFPAFSNSSLNDDPGEGDPNTGAPRGGINRFLLWDDATIEDADQSYGITLFLHAAAPVNECYVDVTPRRIQRLQRRPEASFSWRIVDIQSDNMIQAGIVQSRPDGLITVPDLPLAKTKRRLTINTKTGGAR